MTLDVFWQQIAEAINGECDECPVYQYAVKTNTKRMCDFVCVCADGLKMLHKKLQEEERQKMNKGQQAVKLAREFYNNNCFMCNFEITNENGEKEKICPVYSLREMEVTIDQVLEGFKERDSDDRE